MTGGARGWAALVAAVAIVPLLAAGAFAIHDAGRRHERASWLGKEAERAARTARELQAEYERGRAASAKYQLGASALQSNYLSLQGPFRELRGRVALVLPPRLPQPPHAKQIHNHAESNSAPPTTAVRQEPDNSPHRLSLAAVWMWNSALEGSDVPAGACGLADTSSEACAADAGFTVEDAWINHDINARSCAADRLRHRALIEFLTERPVP